MFDERNGRDPTAGSLGDHSKVGDARTTAPHLHRIELAPQIDIEPERLRGAYHPRRRLAAEELLEGVEQIASEVLQLKRRDDPVRRTDVRDPGIVGIPGEQGELVITTITKEGIPLIRYRTRDITRINYETCICGRTHARIDRMSGRSDDMLIIRGVNVFPSQIESILMGIEGVEPHYLLIVDRKDNLDTLEVQVEVDERLFSDEIKHLQALSHTIEKEIKDILGVTCKARLVEPRTITRSEGKAKRVVDHRTIG